MFMRKDKKYKKKFKISPDPKYNDIFTVRKAPEDEEKLCAITEQAGRQALEAFVRMREREGEKLRDDVLGRCDTIIGIVSEIEERSPQTVEIYRNKLLARLNEVLGETAMREGVTKSAVAIAWILRHPAKMQAVIGSMNPVHIKETCEAGNIELSHNDWYRLYLASGKFLP